MTEEKNAYSKESGSPVKESPEKRAENWRLRTCAHMRQFLVVRPIRIDLRPSMLLAVGALGLVACSKTHGNAGAPDSGIASITAAKEPSVSQPSPSASAAPTFKEPTPQMLFGPKLAQEAQGRPTGTPRAEDVFKAITAAGVALTGEQQHVASTIKAHFCMEAKSPAQINMSVCEYDDEAKAAEGRAMSLNLFAAVQHRDITVNKKTTLTILELATTPEAQAAHDKSIAAFKAL
jgi:hypothetical protein